MSKAEFQFNVKEDKQALLSLVLKRVKAQNEEALLNRYNSLVAYRNILDAITEHAIYVDREQNAASSKNGFASSINRRISVMFGKPVTALETDQELIALARIREAATLAIKQGERAGLLRKEIKAKIRSTMDQVYEIYMGREPSS